MKNNYQIFWNHIDKSTFMYGTVLRKNDTQVCFTNHQTPSGIPLHIWRAKTSFYNDRTTPSLPLLKRGQAYHIKFIYDVRPSSGIYFKIEFFRRNNEVIKTLIINEKAYDFIFPVNAFSYSITMMSATVNTILFERIEISHRSEKMDCSNAVEVFNRWIGKAVNNE